MKRIVFFIFLACIYIPLSATSTISEKYLADYITDCVDYWFYPHNTYPRLYTLKNSILNELAFSSNYEYTWHWASLSYQKEYPLTYIEQLLRGATLDCIKEEAYTYAKEKTSTKQAHTLAERIYETLLNLCLHTSYLEQGIFAPYIGHHLQSLVHKLLNQKPTAHTTITHYYTSTDCCICMESFEEVMRLFLTPCGHDICISCAERWFFTENKKGCPQCRTTVDKKALRETINQAAQTIITFAPSAPPLFY